jgi:hypothetical protein
MIIQEAGVDAAFLSAGRISVAVGSLRLNRPGKSETP